MKFMNLKRFGSLAMAGAMTLSLATPAFAAGNTTTIEGAYEEIPISVSVPTTGTAQINPYGLPVNIVKSDTITNVPITGQKITTRPLSIKNEGETALAVNASLLVVPSGDVSIQGAALTNTEVGKEIDVQLQVVGLDNAKYGVSSISTTLEDDLIDAFAATATWAGAASVRAPAYAKGATGAAVPAAAKSSSAMAVLGAATVQTGGLITYGNDSIALFRLTGDLNAEPNDGGSTPADTPWAETDGFTATVVFKFTPAKSATATADKLSHNFTAAGNTTITASLDAGDTNLTAKSYSWALDDTTKGFTITNGTQAAVTIAAAAAASGNSVTLTCTITMSNDETVSVSIPVSCD